MQKLSMKHLTEEGDPGMETETTETKEVTSPKNIIDIMDEFDIKLLGIEKEKLENIPIQIDIPDETELLRNPYAE